MIPADIELEAASDADTVVDTLRRTGIAVLRGFLNPEVLGRLAGEFDRAFAEPDAGIDTIHRHPTNTRGRVARATTARLGEAGFPATRALWLSQRFREIARAYYEPHPVILNEHVFFTHELPCETEILPWHFDREQSLKFWIYLTDCSEQSGAFEYCPGTHNEGHFRANYYLLKGVHQSRIPNDIPADEIRNPARIEGGAGDLVIFDADGFHKGGIVRPGHERRVIRGHCHPRPPRGTPRGLKPLLARLYGLQSRLAPVLERRIGDRVRTRAEKTRSDEHEPLSPTGGSH